MNDYNAYGEWVNCYECGYFEDCLNKENRDGCYSGVKEGVQE